MGAQRKKQQLSFGNEAWLVGGEGDTSYLSIGEGCTFTWKKKGTQDTGSNMELSGNASYPGDDSRSPHWEVR